MKVLVLLAHHDDEIFILPYLLSEKIIDPLFVFVSQTGIELRRTESIKVLGYFGFDPSQIIELSSDQILKDGELINSLDIIFDSLQRIIIQQNINVILTHMYEGGHPDHDSLAIVSKKLFTSGQISKVINFPFYNSSNLPQPFFRVMSFVKRNHEDELIYRTGIKESFKILRSVFFYVSQWKSFIGLFPGILYRLLISNKKLKALENQEIKSSEAPHPGKLLSEVRFGVPWSIQKELMRKFLNE